jgi:hypothetical protein
MRYVLVGMAFFLLWICFQACLKFLWLFWLLIQYFFFLGFRDFLEI